ncbi:MAG: polysaccharide deacetylase family protein [Bdellovibrionota bacterium]
MKILHLLSQIELTGAEVYAVTLAEWQKKSGHDVFICTDELHQKTNIDFFQLPVHRTTMWTRGKSKQLLLDFILKNRIDVIHAHSRAAVRIAYPCTRKTSCALVTTLHGRPHRSWSKRIFDRYGDKVIAICENLAFDLLLNLKMNARKVQTLANPINLDKIPFKSSIKTSSPFRVGLVGRMTGPKGTRVSELLTQVFPTLLENFLHLQIDLIGGSVDQLDPQGQAQFHRLKEKYKDRIQNQPHIPDLESHLNSYDLIVGAGRVAIACLSSGVPLYAMGEAETVGLVTAQNYTLAKSSNFGDIHYKELFQSMDSKKVTAELLSLIGEKNKLDSTNLQILSQKVAQDFSLTNIAPQILETYKSAIFQKKYPKWIPILMYHQVPDQELQSQHRIFITKDNFEKHLKFFKNKGFQALSFSELKEFRDQKKNFSEFPKKPLLLTFDDGYLNNLKNAVPLLTKYGFKATFFLLADPTVKANIWDKADGTPQLPLMDKSQRAELKKLGQEIGSHGFRHQKLSEMNEQETQQEILDSKTVLEKEFGCEIPVYAYTYGIKNNFAETAVRDAGYTFAVNTTSGGLHLEDNPFSLFRVSIFPEDTSLELRKKTCSWYRRYYYFKRRQ